VTRASVTRVKERLERSGVGVAGSSNCQLSWSFCLKDFDQVPLPVSSTPLHPHFHPRRFPVDSEIKLHDSPMKGSKGQGKNKEKSKALKDDKKKKQQSAPELPEKKNKQKIEELKVSVLAGEETLPAWWEAGSLAGWQPQPPGDQSRTDTTLPEAPCLSEGYLTPGGMCLGTASFSP